MISACEKLCTSGKVKLSNTLYNYGHNMLAVRLLADLFETLRTVLPQRTVSKSLHNVIYSFAVTNLAVVTVQKIKVTQDVLKHILILDIFEIR